MATPVDPTSTAFLMAENRNMPMHVGGLQLFEKPDGAGRNYISELYEQMRDVDDIAPLLKRHPKRAVTAGGQFVWAEDELFDIDHHVRHSALPHPGRVRELLDLCSRLHGTRLARERPLWESHIIEGLVDGRVAMYTKIHHSLIDGVSAMRLLQSVLSSDPERRDVIAPWGACPVAGGAVQTRAEADRNLAEVPIRALRQALGVSAEAAGLPSALIKTLSRGVRNETSALSLHAPRTLFNQSITGSRRFAAQDWEVARMRAIGKATGCTINDVVLAMCSGAIRTYLREQDALPDTPLVAMVPVGLNAKQAQSASADGGNAVGSVMVRLGTDLDDPGRSTAQHPCLDALREARALGDEPHPDPGHVRGRARARDPDPDAADAGHRPAAVQRDHLQRARPTHDAVLQRGETGRGLPALDSHPRDGPQHHLHVVRRPDGVRAHRLSTDGSPPPATADPPRRRARGARGGRRAVSQ